MLVLKQQGDYINTFAGEAVNLMHGIKYFHEGKILETPVYNFPCINSSDKRINFTASHSITIYWPRFTNANVISIKTAINAAEASLVEKYSDIPKITQSVHRRTFTNIMVSFTKKAFVIDSIRTSEDNRVNASAEINNCEIYIADISDCLNDQLADKEETKIANKYLTVFMDIDDIIKSDHYTYLQDNLDPNNYKPFDNLLKNKDGSNIRLRLINCVHPFIFEMSQKFRQLPIENLVIRKTTRGHQERNIRNFDICKVNDIRRPNQLMKLDTCDLCGSILFKTHYTFKSHVIFYDTEIYYMCPLCIDNNHTVTCGYEALFTDAYKVTTDNISAAELVQYFDISKDYEDILIEADKSCEKIVLDVDNSEYDFTYYVLGDKYIAVMNIDHIISLDPSVINGKKFVIFTYL